MFKCNPVCNCVVVVLAAIGLSACNSDDDSTATDTTTTTTDNLNEGLKSELFVSGALISEVTTESCTLSGGTTTTCYRIEIAGVPADQAVGPFCPPTINSTADEGGIWFDGGGDVYDIDGDFIVNLNNLYADSNWLLYDVQSGEVNVTETQEACEGAARPNVAAEYQNHCVECSLDYVGGGVSQTFLIPTKPVALSSASSLGQSDIGVSLNGVALGAPAPVSAILGAYTIAAFDDCGGHINPVAGYHYHGATGCTEVVIQDDGHASLMGYVLDGYAIHGMLNSDGTEPTDLDECRGHTDDARGYHYHAASAGENLFIGCYSGEQGSVL